MRVVATAGHVDHGKSTLVRALTGMEPDRWAEERRRGMTIDLGYAWTTLPSGEIAFVDVPGHQRFIGNMLAGLGAAPGVLFVVAADEGWARQSTEHLAAVAALGIRHGVLAVTRSDLADPASAIEVSLDRLRSAGLEHVDAVATSGATGVGLGELRSALDRLARRLPASHESAAARMWVDRVFTVRGSGTVVTGTLVSGTIAVGDELDLRGRPVSVRAVEALGRPRDRVAAPARVALNLRNVPREEVTRGDVLITPDEWLRTSEIDVRIAATQRLPEQVVLHVGSAALPVWLRVLAATGDVILARIRLPHPLPVRAGDRGVLRDPGRQTVAGGLQVLDADPPALTRRGAAAARARELTDHPGTLVPSAEVARRGAMTRAHLRALGGGEAVPAGTRSVGEWLVSDARWKEWVSAVAETTAQWMRRSPLEDGMPLAALRRELALPDDVVAAAVVAESSLDVRNGRVGAAHSDAGLGPAESGVRAIEARLRAAPFAAPEADDLRELDLGGRELAAAERAGRLIRITPEIVLLPDATDEAVRRLRELTQPFTTSAARQALGTTRRVAVPLLEYLDAHGRTDRVDANTRRVR